MVFPSLCLELVQAEGSCNGCKHSNYNVDNSAPKHVFIFSIIVKILGLGFVVGCKGDTGTGPL